MNQRYIGMILISVVLIGLVLFFGLKPQNQSPPGLDNTDVEIVKVAAKVPEMFANRRVAGKMKAGGSPMHILTREQVQAMWAAREETLKELLAGL